MTTSAQTTANQANAQHSTGPRTVEGKSRVSQNAFRHGLTSKHLVLRDDEHDEFAVFQDSLAAEIDPRGALETIAFHELLHAAWNLHRFRRIEANVSKGTAIDFIDPDSMVILDRLGRYQARAQRSYYKALAELRTLQTNRALRAIKVDQRQAAALPVLTIIREVTKQTQSRATSALPPANSGPDYLPKAPVEEAGFAA